MPPRLRLLPGASLALLFAGAACDASLLAPTDAPSAPVLSVSAEPAATQMEVPVFDEIQDVNPCTGEPITITYTGTGAVHGANGNVVVQSRGDVVTSDGYAGTFNWTFVFVPGHVTHFRSHDAELSSETGERIVFAVGLEHTTWNEGNAVVSFRHSTGARCVGPA